MRWKRPRIPRRRYKKETLYGFLVLGWVSFITLLFIWEHSLLPTPEDWRMVMHHQPSSYRSSSSWNDHPKIILIPRKLCEGYDGVLHIQSGDMGGAAGTIFFLYIVNQLIYAERYNLLPWIHLNNLSHHIYDPIVHAQDYHDGTTTTRNNKNNNIDTTTMTNISFTMMHGMTVEFQSDYPNRLGYGSYAGPPQLLLPKTNQSSSLTPHTYTVSGSGVWNHYFLPVSDFDPRLMQEQEQEISSTSYPYQDHNRKQNLPPRITDCHDKPLIRLHYYQLNPSMLLYCPWSVKSWPYDGLLYMLSPQRQALHNHHHQDHDEHIHKSSIIHQWYEPMRRKGHEIVQKYFHLRPHLVEMARAWLSTNATTATTTTTTNHRREENDIRQHNHHLHRLSRPQGRHLLQNEEEDNHSAATAPLWNTSMTSTNTTTSTIRQGCLAMHIRHSDKGGTFRSPIPVSRFLPYAQAYVDAGGNCIVMATDSEHVLPEITSTWPAAVVTTVLPRPQPALQSRNRQAVFSLHTSHHHRTNTEVLVDIYAMSLCQFLLHGYSAVTEAVFYWNFELHHASVDLEEHESSGSRMTPQEFHALVQTTLSKNIKK